MTAPTTDRARQTLLPPVAADDRRQRLKYLALDLGTWSSTASLYESSHLDVVALDPAHEAALREVLLELLEDPALAPHQQDLLKEVAAVYGPTRSHRFTALTEIRQALRRIGDQWNGVPDRDYLDLRRAVAIAVDRCAAGQAALAVTVHRAYDRVFAVPALHAHRLWQVGLRDGYRQPEIRSILAVAVADIKASHLVDVAVSDADRPAGIVYHPGIKRRLLRPDPVRGLGPAAVPDGWPADTDLLIAQSYADLIKRVRAAVAHAGQPRTLLAGLQVPADSEIDEVTVTYPTTLPPSARARLRRTVSDGTGIAVERVHMDYDEAVASALYFVVRGFGGDVEAGLRSFRAGARPVEQALLPTWRRNALVLDIGGGTTDIALLALDLVATRPGGTAADGPRGRHYTLTPRVLGTTGHPQLGGDLLTLRVFYWLKAAVVDAIDAGHAPAARDADDRTLTERLLASGHPKPVTDDVRRILRERLPSHSATPGVRTAAFDRLWEAAEDAKINYLSQGKGYRIEQTFADSLPSDCTWRDAVRALPDGAVVLAPEDFDRMIRPVVGVAAGLAASLVRRTLGRQPGEQLDLVALSGRTTTMPAVHGLIRTRMTEQFLRHDRDGAGPIPWDPQGMLVEHAYAKQTASLGACWARSVKGLSGVDDQRLEAGLDQLEISVHNLLACLPSDFGLAGDHDRVPPLLHQGTVLDKATRRGVLASPPGNLFACTDWKRLNSDDLHLHRILGPELTVQWGAYQYSRHRPGPLPAGLWYRIAVDQELNAWISFCRGTRDAVRPALHPLNGTDLDAGEHLDLLQISRLGEHFDRDGDLLTLPDIEVAAVEEGEDEPEYVTVFRTGTAEQRLSVDLATETSSGTAYAATRPLAASRLPAAVSTSALPVTRTGTLRPAAFVFRARIPGADPVPLGRIRPPQFRDGDYLLPDVPFWAVLDQHGRLRVNAGYPEFLETDSLVRMESEPGWVYTTAMPDSSTDWDPTWDPTTGDH
ncbi:hypothetical protein Cs7R123_08970 [Catellatospora sp. TT07R-123]|uniref:hypothetical protein n=1 Tax=Catellatospora sp. TT07R-123 TaxID=2733863 RepID=UPI001B2B96E1|nr:hypothetical protein [Catellatospora sp. TT07R-123]GHJ43555.1 hypothetical protein Cs7R123_08970 [Catellatospora sp. TT07R-123]